MHKARYPEWKAKFDFIFPHYFCSGWVMSLFPLVISGGMHVLCTHNSSIFEGPGWLNELGSWITLQLIQAYHQYGVGSCPTL